MNEGALLQVGKEVAYVLVLVHANERAEVVFVSMATTLTNS